MPTKVIIISHGDPSTGVLQVPDIGADRTHKVIWQIRNNSGVDSIAAIVPKTSTENIWATPPHPQGNHWEGDVSASARYGAVHSYSIHWRAVPAGPVLHHDPKITIKPDANIDHFLTVISGVVAAMLALFMVRFFRKRNR
jgi:hypothetical protein